MSYQDNMKRRASARNRRRTPVRKKKLGGRKGFFGSIAGFISNNRLIAIIAAGAVLIAALVLVAVFVVLPAIKASQTAAQPVYVEPVVSYIPEDTSEDTLPEEEIVEEDIAAIGLLLGAGGEYGQAVMDGFGECAQELISSGSGLEKYYIYNADEGEDQQIQDIRSLINYKCRAIVAYGLSSYTADIVTQLCAKADIPVVGVEQDAELFSANVKGAEAWYEGYAQSAAASLQEGETVMLVTDKSGSDFTEGVTAALTAKGITPSATIYTSDKKYKTDLEKTLKKRPDVMIVRGGSAEDILMLTAKADRIPRVLVTRATVGIINEWNELKSSGLVTVEAVVPKEGDTKTKPVDEVRVFSEDSLLYAYAGLDGTMLGRAACRFAFNYAMGKALIQEGIEITLSSELIITDAELAEYYALYQDENSEMYIPGPVDTGEIDAFFKEAESDGI